MLLGLLNSLWNELLFDHRFELAFRLVDLEPASFGYYEKNKVSIKGITSEVLFTSLVIILGDIVRDIEQDIVFQSILHLGLESHVL